MENKIDNSRKFFIDNIRSVTVIIVVIYHVIYLFNSVGVPKTIGIDGIPAFDLFCYPVYPWFMTIMFLLAGMSARYALQKRNEKYFIKGRIQKLLIPLVGGMFLLAWVNGWVTNQYVDIFEGNNVPAIVKYFIYCLMIGPLWFNLELFIASLVLLLFRKVDKRERFLEITGKINIIGLFLLVIPFWGSSFLFNVPLITTFRNGIYLFTFLVGYYVFSNEKIIQALVRMKFITLVIAIILGIIETYYFYGKNFTNDDCLQHPLTNVYAWIMMMAILGFSKKYFDITNYFLHYIRSRSFYWYLCHYPIMAFSAYFLTSHFKLPMIYNYILVLIIGFGLTILFCEIIKIIPILRYLLFGIKNKNK
ncbi:hypothetical protein FACS189483_05090 [Spirochaetia bacterium]|nr:hypothetical protein FACS189483_05090 [Spirochaetia bacterium]